MDQSASALNDDNFCQKQRDGDSKQQRIHDPQSDTMHSAKNIGKNF